MINEANGQHSIHQGFPMAINIEEAIGIDANTPDARLRIAATWQRSIAEKPGHRP